MCLRRRSLESRSVKSSMDKPIERAARRLCRSGETLSRLPLSVFGLAYLVTSGSYCEERNVKQIDPFSCLG